MSEQKQEPSGLLPRKIVEMDRLIKDVVAPPLYELTEVEVFAPDGSIRLPLLMTHLQKEGRLEASAAHRILREVSALLRSEPNVLDLSYPLTVCGDLHGQFFDLIRLFEVGGDPANTKYLFLGDYVDRGCFSTEVVFYMYALKLTYKSSLWMLRGNHECRQLTAFFNFKDECIYKYSEDMYDKVMDSFDCLPIGALVNKTFFCMHGGLSPDIQTIAEICSLERFHEIPRDGPMCDLLWSDPFEQAKEREHDGGDAEEWYGYNDTRQCSYVFGQEAVKAFLRTNRLTSIIRAHEAQVDGYKMHFVNPATGIPRVITIFSAPNYCDVFKNKAAVLQFDTNLLNIKQFVDSPHPYYLPNFMDVFQWSIPFVAEKVTDILSSVIAGADDEPEETDVEMTESLVQKAPKLKAKIKAVTKLLRMYKTLRINNDAIVQLKQLTPNNKIPFGLLTAGTEEIHQAISSFNHAFEADLVNEQYPHAAGEERKSGVFEQGDPLYEKRTSIKHKTKHTIQARTSLAHVSSGFVEQGEGRLSLTLPNGQLKSGGRTPRPLTGMQGFESDVAEDDDDDDNVVYVPPVI